LFEGWEQPEAQRISRGRCADADPKAPQNILRQLQIPARQDLVKLPMAGQDLERVLRARYERCY